MSALPVLVTEKVRVSGAPTAWTMVGASGAPSTIARSVEVEVPLTVSENGWESLGLAGRLIAEAITVTVVGPPGATLPFVVIVRRTGNGEPEGVNCAGSAMPLKV